MTLPLTHFVPQTAEMVAMLRRFAEIESPSTVKAAVDRFGAAVAEEARRLGARVTLHPRPEVGDIVMAEWNTANTRLGPPLLFLFHMDTVHELGTLQRFPVTVDGELLRGPGVFDMKGSFVVFFFALRALRALLPAPHRPREAPLAKHSRRERQGAAQTGLQRPLVALFTSDEETGSGASRGLIESLARGSAAVFCMEPAAGNGELKTFRKGTGEIVITARGRASHAGTDHDKGRNAIEELAHHILSVQKLTDYARGTTTNVGVIHSPNTRTNVVPDEARAWVDFRVSRQDEVQRLRDWAAGLRPVIEGCTVEAQVSTNRPPMPRDSVMVATFQKAQAVARTLGLEIGETGTGGGSDANFVAPLGVPVLDGLGPRGNGGHSEREHVIIASLPERTALLAELIREW